MARHWFLGTPADWAVALGADETSADAQPGKRALVIPAGTLTFWNGKAGGTRYTDLLDDVGSAIDTATAGSDGEYPQVQGPDEVVAMWADGSGGAGPRRLVLATDVVEIAAANTAAISDLQEQAAALQALAALAPVIVRENGDGTWPVRPDIAGDRTALWVGPDTPAVGGDYMLDGTDLYIDTQP